MSGRSTRRDLLRFAALGGAGWGLGEHGFLAGLPRVSAAEARQGATAVQLPAEIEPVVRLLEQTPREKLLEEVAARIRKGLSYREVVSALLLAGVKNIQPRPSVGFKFHAVLVVNSVHLASISSPESDRWLPIFWALDYFKDAQAQNAREGGWTMGPVAESAVPAQGKARDAFRAAMDDWDEPAADAAAAAVARHLSAQEVFELFYRYGARDFRSIGHKAIFVANSQRVLASMGGHYAEPVIRSLAYALLQHEGENPAKRDAAADRPGRRNQDLVGKLRTGWQEGKPDDGAVPELLVVLRRDSADDVSRQVVEVLNRGVAPQSVWDAIFLGAAELLARQPGIVSLHALTSTNALCYAYRSTSDDRTRGLVLLQNAAFLPLFREAMAGRGGVADRRIDAIEPLAPSASGPQAVDEIFADLSRERAAAARKTLAYLQAGGEAKSLIDAARRLIFLKGTDSHDYKFSSAVLEDYQHVSPAWRGRFLAGAMYHLCGSGDRDNPLVGRIRAASGEP